MNVNTVSSAKNMNFGFITNNAYQKIMEMDGERFDRNNVKYPMKIQADKDFILHYNKNKDRFGLYSVERQCSMITNAHRYRPKINFLKFIIDKMTTIKDTFPTIPLRDKNLTTIEVNKY